MHILVRKGLLRIQFNQMIMIKIVMLLVVIISNSTPIRDGSLRHQYFSALKIIILSINKL